MKTIILVSITVFSAWIGRTQVWQSVGITPSDIGWSPHIVSDNGKLYVAFSNSSFETSVMHYENNTWEYLGQQNSDPFVGSYNATMFDVSNNTPYFLTRNAQQRAIAKTYNGNAWVQLGGDISSDTVLRMSLIAENGTPYVAYRTALGTSVKYYDGSNWLLLGNENFSQGSGNSLIIAIDNGIPYVLYHDFSLSVLFIHYFDGTSWVQLGQGVPILSGNGQGACLLVYNATAYVSYPENTALNTFFYNGSVWTPIGNPASFPIGTPMSGSGITINESGEIYAVHNNPVTKDVYVFKLNDTMTDWEQVGALVSDNAINCDITVVGSVPFVAYKDYADGNIKVSKYDFGVGLTEQEHLEVLISLSPNPSSSMIEIMSLLSIQSITIVNSEGRELLATKQASIDISLFASGLYFAHIQTERGIITKRFTKE